jgi:hypothetical protein
MGVSSAECRQPSRFGSSVRNRAPHEIALSRTNVVPPGWIEQPTPGLGMLWRTSASCWSVRKGAAQSKVLRPLGDGSCSAVVGCGRASCRHCVGNHTERICSRRAAKLHTHFGSGLSTNLDTDHSRTGSATETSVYRITFAPHDAQYAESALTGEPHAAQYRAFSPLSGAGLGWLVPPICPRWSGAGGSAASATAESSTSGLQTLASPNTSAMRFLRSTTFCMRAVHTSESVGSGLSKRPATPKRCFSSSQPSH